VSRLVRSRARPRRVALVIGQLTRGGAEGQLAQIARHLDRTAFEPRVYCLSAQVEPVGAEIVASGVAVRVICGSQVSRVRQLARGLQADGIELVHAWLYVANALAGAAHLLQPSRPLITSARNRKLQGWANRLANILAFRMSGAIIANSAEVAAYIEQRYGAPRQRIHVIPNGIDTQRFRPVDAGISAAPTIVTVGRLVNQKNHALFLQAASRLLPRCPDLRFVIVGDGPLRGELEERARTLEIADRVTFAGERHDVDTILRRASLFWLTSRWEGMPNVVLEAMASGLPVIATDVGGTRELIPPNAGFVVPSEEVDGFVQHSGELLHDAALRQRFALAARARAEAFSIMNMVYATAQLYDELLGRAQ
jgi:glycosyltransferase involved in cell wall biosynthesis